MLVDIYREDQPNEVHRIYAIVDDQGNASIISTELADKLNVEGPQWKYYLSTCLLAILIPQIVMVIKSTSLAQINGFSSIRPVQI